MYDNRGVFIDEEILKGHWKRNSLKVKLFRKIEEIIIRKSEAIIVVSRKFKDYLIKKFDRFQIENKITVIPNRTHIKYSLEEFSKNDNQIIGVYSGSASKWQNLNEIKKFMSIACRELKNIKFKILTYHLDSFFSLFSNEKEIENQIEIMSNKPHEVFETLKQCDFSLLIRDNNLINNVASPLKFAEYLAAGLPIIISKGIGDTEEIVNCNRVGVIYNEDNPKESILKMVELVNKNTKKRCLDLAENHFNIKTSFEQYQNIFNRL